MPALVHASRTDEIRNALKVFRDEFNLDVIILGGDDGYRVTPELRRYDVGLAIAVNAFRLLGTIRTDEMKEMKG